MKINDGSWGGDRFVAKLNVADSLATLTLNYDRSALGDGETELGLHSDYHALLERIAQRPHNPFVYVHNTEIYVDYPFSDVSEYFNDVAAALDAYVDTCEGYYDAFQEQIDKLTNDFIEDPNNTYSIDLDTQDSLVTMTLCRAKVLA